MATRHKRVPSPSLSPHTPCQPLATVRLSCESPEIFRLFFCHHDKMAHGWIWQEHAQPRKHWQQELSFLVVVNCLTGSPAFTLKKCWKLLMQLGKRRNHAILNSVKAQHYFFFFTTVLWKLIQVIKTYSTVTEAKHCTSQDQKGSFLRKKHSLLTTIVYLDPGLKPDW